MASKKLESFRAWFTPKRRRGAGGALLIMWIIGLVAYPSNRWLYVMIPAVIFFFSAWPPEVHDSFKTKSPRSDRDEMQ